MVQQVQQSGNQSPKDKLRAALKPVVEHPIWAKLPAAILDGFEYIETAEFSPERADRIAHAWHCMFERGLEIGEPEEAFLAAAREAFAERKGFWATAIDFAQEVVASVDPADKRTPKQVRDHADLVHYIFLAANDKPELLGLLNDSAYRNLDPSVCNNPHLEALLEELLVNKCLQVKSHKDAVKVMLSPLRANWTKERCEAASRSFAAQGYFRDYDLARMRALLTHPRELYKKVTPKILPIARALRLQYEEEMVLRFEAICFTLQAARVSHHA